MLRDLVVAIVAGVVLAVIAREFIEAGFREALKGGGDGEGKRGEAETPDAGFLGSDD